nr:thiamine-phosphate kinase [Ferrimonas sediminicola]
MWPFLCMPISEFELIERFFRQGCQRGNQRKDVLMGIGDDAAILRVPANNQLVVTTDTLVEGIHFLPSIDPEMLAYKSVAVNLSDLAAMGADPAWLTLALTLPRSDETWLSRFAAGLNQICEYYGIALVGGDTTRGPLTITLTALGHVPSDQSLSRSGAKPGDWIFVTGHLGDSAAGLKLLKGELQASDDHREFLVTRHLRPTPRILAGRSLRGIASACLDLSDGLAGDLEHIVTASGVGAHVEIDKLPLSKALLETLGDEEARQLAIRGGEDYELLFTVPEAQKGALMTALGEAGVSHSCIGQIRAGSGIHYYREGEPLQQAPQSFRHF